jgi:LmbE family N-acetylglucosaminyl deacetylase
MGGVADASGDRPSGDHTVLKLDLPPRGEGYRLLALGAHSDDLEIGCGGTVLRLVEAGLVSEAWWIVLSGDEARAHEAEAGARAFLDGTPRSKVLRRRFRDGYFPHDGGAIKDFFEELKVEFQPDIVFSHRGEDRHQDHRLVSELTWNTFRNHLILEYEVPKYDGDLRSPNVFVELSEETCRRKVESIVATFASQSHRAWFTEDVFWALLRLRGFEAGAGSGYAEGFHSRKLLL